jgi:hypothetical protein
MFWRYIVWLSVRIPAITCYLQLFRSFLQSLKLKLLLKPYRELYNDHSFPNSSSLSHNSHSPISVTLMLTCPAHSLNFLVIIPSYSLTLMVTCSSYSLFWSPAHLIHSFGQLPILFTLMVTCPSYSLFWSLAHLIHSFGQLPILFTLMVTCPSFSLLWALAHLIHTILYPLAHVIPGSLSSAVSTASLKNLITHSI